MQFWNREQLYVNAWKMPLGKLAAQYGVTHKVLVRVCNRLQIPLPQPGHWRKVEVGRPVQRLPLPRAKNLPLIPYGKRTLPLKPVAAWQQNGLISPDALLATIRRIESVPLRATQREQRHNLIVRTAAALEHVEPRQYDCVLPRPLDRDCLDLRVSRTGLKRALEIMNAILLLLEQEGFKVQVSRRDQRTVAFIFGQTVPFCLTEKLRVEWRHRIRNLNKTSYQFKPTGDLEFQAGARTCTAFKLRDGKRLQLHKAIHLCVGGLMREARGLRFLAKQAAQLEIAREQKSRELAALATLVNQEEKKVERLQGTVKNWREAQEIRSFIAALKSLMSAQHGLDGQGHDIAWMKEQASRLDPLEESPQSVLDRKPELAPHFSKAFLPIVPEMIQAFEFTSGPSVTNKHFQRLHRKRKHDKSTR